MFPVNTIIAWYVNIYHKHEDMIITYFIIASWAYLQQLDDNAKNKLMGSINDVLIMVNNAYVPVDFYVLDVEYNASCHITLGRPFLRTVGAIIDMKEDTIKYHFLFKKGIQHLPMRRDKLLFAPPLKAR